MLKTPLEIVGMPNERLSLEEAMKQRIVISGRYQRALLLKVRKRIVSKNFSSFYS